MLGRGGGEPRGRMGQPRLGDQTPVHVHAPEPRVRPAAAGVVQQQVDLPGAAVHPVDRPGVEAGGIGEQALVAGVLDAGSVGLVDLAGGGGRRSPGSPTAGPEARPPPRAGR